MAGAFDRELTPTDTLWQQAHMKYISNLRFAAEQCSKVRVHCMFCMVCTSRSSCGLCSGVELLECE